LPKSGGRKKGVINKRTREIAEAAVKEGITPLEYMLNVVRDPMAAPDRRDRMAIAAAPFVHPRLAAIEAKVDTSAQVEVTLTEEQRVRQAREAIEAAFAEVVVARDERERDQTGEQPRAVGERDERPDVAKPDRDALPIPREFARGGELEAAPGVARLPTRYHVPRVPGNWSG
jgi:hypothetical protein